MNSNAAAFTPDAPAFTPQNQGNNFGQYNSGMPPPPYDYNNTNYGGNDYSNTQGFYNQYNQYNQYG